MDPCIVLLPPSASKGGVSEKMVRVCEECKEEFCLGTCIIFQYDSYQVRGSVRLWVLQNCITQRLIKDTEDEDAEGPDEAAKKKKKRSVKSAKKK